MCILKHLLLNALEQRLCKCLFKPHVGQDVCHLFYCDFGDCFYNAKCQLLEVEL